MMIRSLFMGCALALGLCLSSAGEAAERLDWDDLAPSMEDFVDPFSQLLKVGIAVGLLLTLLASERPDSLNTQSTSCDTLVSRFPGSSEPPRAKGSMWSTSSRVRAVQRTPPGPVY